MKRPNESFTVIAGFGRMTIENETKNERRRRDYDRNNHEPPHIYEGDGAGCGCYRRVRRARCDE